MKINFGLVSKGCFLCKEQLLYSELFFNNREIVLCLILLDLKGN
jgi:hypothetical protein